MKSIRYILLSGIVGLSLWACKEDDLGPVVNLGNAPAITAPTSGATFVLLEDNAGETLPGFSWTEADFGFPSGTSYRVEIDLAGNDFAESVALGVVSDLALTIEQGTLNNILLAKGLEGDIPASLEMRVIATVSEDVPALVSAPVSMSVTPYESTVVLPQLQVPGSYQGWDPSNNSTVIFSRNSDNKFEGFLHFGEDNAFFKYTLGPSWDTNWGDNGNDGTLEPGGADIPMMAAGVYRLNVDLNALTHTRVPTNWGLIGNATPGGWDSDQDLIYDSVSGRLTITVDLVPGFIKFRANDAWDLNMGDDGNNLSLEFNGADIPIDEAGNYTIDLLILGVPNYTYTITKN